MQPPKKIAGLYIERDQALLMLMEGTGDDLGRFWQLKHDWHEPAEWHPDIPEDALASIRYLLRKAMAERPDAIGLACYGPFRSLVPNTDYFGELHDKFASSPFCGQNLERITRETLIASGQANYDPSLYIQTDANACALGEAIARNPEADPGKDGRDLLGYIICGEGVGLGLVQGRDIVRSALHPEIGLIPTRSHDDDPLGAPARTRDGPVREDYSRSLAQMASDDAVARRLARIRGLDQITLREVAACRDQVFWDSRAYYLAQACLVCTVVAPPNAIVIGAKIDPLGNVGPRTLRQLKRFLKRRKLDRQPVIEYAHLRAPGYIANPTRNPRIPTPHAMATTGVVGICHAAAAAMQRGEVVHIGRGLV